MSSLKLRSLLLVLILMLVPAEVSANGGPLYDPAAGYGLLQLDEHSNISLVHEKIMYSVSQDSNYYTSRAEVTVQYELHNKSDVKKAVDVLFLTPSKEALTVTEGDSTIAASVAAELRPVNWRPEVKTAVIEPVSVKELSLNLHGGMPIQALGARFSLSFEENETKAIVIRYVENGGIYDKGVINMIYSHLYYLTPAKFWEGEPQVELEVNLDARGSKLHSNLPMEQLSPTTYRATLNGLPSEEWYFSYTYPKRLLFPTNIEKDHNLMVLGSVAVFTAIMAALALGFRKSYMFTIGAIASFSFTLYYISKMGGYPFDVILVPFTDAVVGICLILCNLFIWRKNKSRRVASSTDRVQ